MRRTSFSSVNIHIWSSYCCYGSFSSKGKAKSGYSFYNITERAEIQIEVII